MENQVGVDGTGYVARRLQIRLVGWHQVSLLHHFIEYVKCLVDEPVLLLLDNHISVVYKLG